MRINHLFLLLVVTACGSEDELGLLEQGLEVCATAVPVASVLASAEQLGNLAPNAIDGNLNTRWSGKGVGVTLSADLGAVRPLCGVAVAWYLGDTRSNTFALEVSSDNTLFTRVFTGASGLTTALQTHRFAPTIGRYVRLVFSGNSAPSSSEWASVAELKPLSVSPTAAFELEARDLSVSADDAASTGGGSTVASWEWSWGDGSTSTGRTPHAHLYAGAGTYLITLTITNAAGDRATSTRSVTVHTRLPGDYAPDDATTGVPDVVKDRLFLLDLEKPGKTSTDTPTVNEETLFITGSSGAWVFTHNGRTLSLPAEHLSVQNGRLIIDRVHIRGYLDVRAPNVTLRRSVVEGLRIPLAAEVAAPNGINVGRRLLRGNNVNATDLVLEDIEVRVPAAAQRGSTVNAGYHHSLGLEATRLTLLRSEVTGTVDGMQIHEGAGTSTSVLVERSWFHDLQFYGSDLDRTARDATHSDGIQIECSLPAVGQLFGARLVGNVIDMSSDPNLNSSVMVTKNSCATSGVRIDHNFLDGAVFALNIGGGTSSQTITVYANSNRVGPNRTTGSVPNKTWLSSTTAKVFAVKSNTNSSAAFENYDTSRPQSWTYFSFDPPSTVGGTPPSGEVNRNSIVAHERNSSSWGSTSVGVAGLGLY